MTDIVQLVEGMTEADKRVALIVLDAVSRPLMIREIEGLLRHAGASRSQAVKVASALRGWSLIAVLGPEGAAADGYNPRPVGPTPFYNSRIHNSEHEGGGRRKGESLSPVGPTVPLRSIANTTFFASSAQVPARARARQQARKDRP